MTDYCLKMPTESDFNTLMLDTGLCVEVDGEVMPADYTVLIDRIGPITIGEVTYPEYYVNLRLLREVTEEQVAELGIYAIDPTQPQYRVWA